MYKWYDVANGGYGLINGNWQHFESESAYAEMFEEV